MAESEQREKLDSEIFNHLLDIGGLTPAGRSILPFEGVTPRDITVLQFFWKKNGVGPIEITSDGEQVFIYKGQKAVDEYHSQQTGAGEENR